MLEDIFDINKFNIYSDEEYYYFFKPIDFLEFQNELNKSKSIADNFEDFLLDLINKKYPTMYGNANNVIYNGKLNECEKYVIIKIPKKSKDDTVLLGTYLIEKIEERINTLIKELPIDPLKYLESLNNKKIESLATAKGLKVSEIRHLNENQKLIVEKLFIELKSIGEDLFENISNQKLIDILINSFKNMDIIHLGPIKDYRNISSDSMDILSLFQQIPQTLNLENLKSELIKKVMYINYQLNIEFEPINEDLFDPEVVFDYIKSCVPYDVACNLYKSAYYLSKSRLKVLYFIDYIRNKFSSIYEPIFDKIEKRGMCIELFLNSKNNDTYQISENINLNLINGNYSLYNFILSLSLEKLKFNVEPYNDEEVLKELSLRYYKNTDKTTNYSQSKIDWYLRGFLTLTGRVRKKIYLNSFDVYYEILENIYTLGISMDFGYYDKVKIYNNGTIKLIKRALAFDRNGNIIVLNKNVYDNPLLVNLGKWLYENEFTEEQLKKLHSLGCYPEKNTSKRAIKFEEQFELYYSLLIKLFNQGYKCEINPHDKAIIDDGIVEIISSDNGKQLKSKLKEKKLIPIGKWLHNSRKKFNKSQLDQLEKVGFLQYSFDDYFDILNKLYIKGDIKTFLLTDKVKIMPNGDISLVKYFPTHNEEHDQMMRINHKYHEGDIVYIGAWLKHNYKNFTEEQTERLKSIGIFMDKVTNSLATKFEIKNICLQYNINYEENKDVLDYISYQELLAKILYLESENISIFDYTLKLHPIFKMRDKELSKVYGVTSEELINKFVYSNKQYTKK